MKRLAVTLAGLALLSATPALGQTVDPARILFIDLHGVRPLQLYIDDKILFDGFIQADSNDGTGLDLTMNLPLRGRHKFRLITDRGDRTEMLDITDDKHVILLSRMPEKQIMLVHQAMLD